jgi:hypothetical protein
MLLIWLVNGMIRMPFVLALLVLLIPVAVVFVIITSPVRLFNKNAHETLCDKFLMSSFRLLTLVAVGKPTDFCFGYLTLHSFLFILRSERASQSTTRR